MKRNLLNERKEIVKKVFLEEYEKEDAYNQRRELRQLLGSTRDLYIAIADQYNNYYISDVNKKLLTETDIVIYKNLKEIMEIIENDITALESVINNE